MAGRVPTKKFINKTSGPRRNMNGAGEGGRLVAQRGNSSVKSSATQLGNRRQRYDDIRAALGMTTG